MRNTPECSLGTFKNGREEQGVIISTVIISKVIISIVTRICSLVSNQRFKTKKRE